MIVRTEGHVAWQHWPQSVSWPPETAVIRGHWVTRGSGQGELLWMSLMTTWTPGTGAGQSGAFTVRDNGDERNSSGGGVTNARVDRSTFHLIPSVLHKV